jgi:hypothetical protein
MAEGERLPRRALPPYLSPFVSPHTSRAHPLLLPHWTPSPSPVTQPRHPAPSTSPVNDPRQRPRGPRLRAAEVRRRRAATPPTSAPTETHIQPANRTDRILPSSSFVPFFFLLPNAAARVLFIFQSAPDRKVGQVLR